VSLAPSPRPVRGPERFFDIPACPLGGDRSTSYLYGMYDKIVSYLYAMYGNLAYDLYVLYGRLDAQKRSKSHLNHYGSNGYI